MAPIIVVIAAGEMGAAIGQRLRLRGASVRTSLKGRSDATIARAKAAGLVAIEDDAALVADADFVLSVMPPGEAKNLAKRLAPVLTALPRKPVFADCNAVAPETVRDIAAIVAPTGCVFAAGVLDPRVSSTALTTISSTTAAPAISSSCRWFDGRAPAAAPCCV